MKSYYLRITASLLALLILSSALTGCRKVEEKPEVPSIESTADAVLETEETKQQKDEATSDKASDTEAEPTKDTTGKETEATTDIIEDTSPTETRKPQSETKAPVSTTEKAPDKEEPKNDRFASVPASLKKHPLLESKGVGECKELKGNILITFVFLDDSESSWNDSARSTAKAEMNKEISRLKSLASGYGVSLNISTDYRNGNVKKTDMGSGVPFYAWIHGAISSAGLNALIDLNSRIEEANKNVDEAPVIFLVNKPGRAYANAEDTDNDTGEYAVLFNDEYYAFCHELLHLFGAKDFYYPISVKTAVTTQLGSSIMTTSKENTVDSLTAFIVGWTDTLSTDATKLLNATSSITKSELDAARTSEMLTGNGTKTTSMGTYTGDMVMGTFEGYGKYVLNDGRIYEGNWTNGALNGYGKYTSPDGDVYEGDWVDYKRHGKGTLSFVDGDKYEGDWANDKKHGQGTYTWSVGAKYVGAWSEGSRNGQGTFTTTDGYTYTGNWVNDQRSGKGTCTWADGSKYEGDWSNDVFNGQGTYTWKNGDKYEGGYLNELRNGYGVLTKADGSKYVGNWSNDKRSGKGSMTWASGTSYDGDWANDAFNGYGTYIFKNGDSYTGYWKDSLMHGQGKYTYANGKVVEGTWENDKYVG